MGAFPVRAKYKGVEAVRFVDADLATVWEEIALAYEERRQPLPRHLRLLYRLIHRILCVFLRRAWRSR